MVVSQNVVRLSGNDANVFEFDCTIKIFQFGCKILRRNSGTIIRSIVKNNDGKNASVGGMTTQDRDDQYEVLGM